MEREWRDEKEKREEEGRGELTEMKGEMRQKENKRRRNKDIEERRRTEILKTGERNSTQEKERNKKKYELKRGKTRDRKGKANAEKPRRGRGKYQQHLCKIPRPTWLGPQRYIYSAKETLLQFTFSYVTHEHPQCTRES